MVDYSKWDKVGGDLADDGDGGGFIVRVTPLDDEEATMGRSVGAMCEGEDSDEAEDVEDGHDQGHASEEKYTCRKSPERALPVSSEDLNYLRHKLTENGAETEGYLWAQSQLEMCVRIKVPLVRPSAVQAFIEDQKLCVAVNSKLWFRKRLRHQVCQDTANARLDWELHDFPFLSVQCRFLSIFLKKAHTAFGHGPWWSTPFEGDAEIDVSCIPDQYATDLRVVDEFFSTWSR